MTAPSSARCEPTGHGMRSAGSSLRQPREQPLRLAAVLVHDRDQARDVHRAVHLVPAVVVGHHRNDRVGDLRLARELGLRHRGHVDDVVAESLVGERLGPRGELRTLHAHRGAAPMAGNRLGHGRAGDQFLQRRPHRVREGHVGDATRTEERTLAAHGAVHEVVHQHEGAGAQFLAVGAAGRERHEVGHAQLLQRVDVGAVVDLGGRQAVAPAVPRQEHDVRAAGATDAQPVRRLAPGRVDALLAHVLDAGQVVEAGAADDAEHCLGHRIHSP